MLRPAKSDTDVRTPNFGDLTDEKAILRDEFDVPPIYNPDKYSSEESDSDSSQFLRIPGCEPIKRSSSALGWFGRHFS